MKPQSPPGRGQGEGFRPQIPPGQGEKFRPQGPTGGSIQPRGEGVGPEGFPMPSPEGFHPHRPEGFHAASPYPPFQGHPYYSPASRPVFPGSPEEFQSQGFGMYPPHQFPPGHRMFGPGFHPNPYHPMMPPVPQVPGGPPAGRGGFMIDNLLRSKSGEIPPPAHMPVPSQGNAPQMPPPSATPPQGTPPHVTPPHVSPPPHIPVPHATPAHATPPHTTPPHATSPYTTPSHAVPPHLTSPHSTPPHQPQLQQQQQLQPQQLQQKPPPADSPEREEKGKSSLPPRPPKSLSQDEEPEDNDVSDIMSYVMNDEFFKQQTSS